MTKRLKAFSLKESLEPVCLDENGQYRVAIVSTITVSDGYELCRKYVLSKTREHRFRIKKAIKENRVAQLKVYV